jgi:hypothetical protein
VIAVALILFGSALAPLSAQLVQRPRHAPPAVSPVVSLWNDLLTLIGLGPGGQAGIALHRLFGASDAPTSAIVPPPPNPPPGDADARATVDPDG